MSDLSDADAAVRDADDSLHRGAHQNSIALDEFCDQLQAVRKAENLGFVKVEKKRSDTGFVQVVISSGKHEFLIEREPQKDIRAKTNVEGLQTYANTICGIARGTSGLNCLVAYNEANDEYVASADATRLLITFLTSVADEVMSRVVRSNRKNLRA